MSSRETNFDKPIRRVVILGGGSAGFLAALALKTQLPDLDLVMIRSTKLGVIGVGEGTIISVVPFLHQYLGLPSQKFHEQVRPGIKLGIKYLWGKRPFFHYTFSRQLTAAGPLAQPRGYFCQDNFDFADQSAALMVHDKACLRRIDGQPRFASSVAYHLENRLFVAHLEQAADELGIQKIDDLVRHVEVDERGIKQLVLESGPPVRGDLYLDCSGFRSELLGKALGEEYVDFKQSLFCDKAAVGGWTRTDEPYHPYTTAETMDAGWCWRIEHDQVINRGYVFSSAFVSNDQAEEEFRKKNPRVEDVRIVPFPAGCRRRCWVKNVVGIGNSVGFVEPLEATAIAGICDMAAHLVRALKASAGYQLKTQVDIFNRVSSKNWEIIRDFLALHYKFNDRLDTPFWQAARADVDIGSTQELVDYYQLVGPNLSLLNYDLKRDFFSSEGYLAMLVGQSVPYQRPTSISESEQTAWNQYKSELNKRAEAGMGVQECVDFLRKSGLTPKQGGERPVENGRSADPSNSLGELHWH